MMYYRIPIGDFVKTIQTLVASGSIGQGVRVIAAGSRWFTVKLSTEHAWTLRRAGIDAQIDE